MLARYGPRVAMRFLTAGEQAGFAAVKLPERFLAKRFAVKEAFAKALGTGMRAAVGLRSIEVAHDALGKPILRFAPALAALMDQNGLVAHVSVSDESDYALAFVVVEKLDKEN